MILWPLMTEEISPRPEKHGFTGEDRRVCSSSRCQLLTWNDIFQISEAPVTASSARSTLAITAQHSRLVRLPNGGIRKSPDGVWPDGIDRDVALRNFELSLSAMDLRFVQMRASRRVLRRSLFMPTMLATSAMLLDSFRTALGRANSDRRRTSSTHLEHVVSNAYGAPVRFMKRGTR